MAAPPKTKPTSAPSRAGSGPDRTSTVVAAALILLTGLGVVTVFWEPLTALALGAPAGEAVGESHAPLPVSDGGASGSALPDASGSS